MLSFRSISPRDEFGQVTWHPACEKPVAQQEARTMADKPIVDVAEQKRLNDAREAGIPWKKWGPYLSERQWGTVRED